jgi:fructose-1,6-bisphosphatase I
MDEKILTLQQHIRLTEKAHEAATGALSALLTEIEVATKIISREVNKAGIAETVLGLTGKINVQGEEVVKLDDYANMILKRMLTRSRHVCIMASEEEADPIEIPERFVKGKYVVTIDPLDGSSNIDVNASIGTIFSIRRKVTEGPTGRIEDILRKGTEQVAAGYVIYGSSTILVYTTGSGVFGFTLDPSVGEFLLSHSNIEMPEKGAIYSVNEGYASRWDKEIRNYISYLKEEDHATGRPYKGRYIGSLVADFHRTLWKGGIFLYPADTKNPSGKLRLLYEACPLALVAEHAGGMATDGNQRILDIEPERLHQRVPLIIGSKKDVETFHNFMKGKKKEKYRVSKEE